MKSQYMAVFLVLCMVSVSLWADSTDTKTTSNPVMVVEEELSLEEELELIDSDLLVTEEVKIDSTTSDSVETASSDSTESDTTKVERSGPSSSATSFTNATGRKKTTADTTDTADLADSIQAEEFSLSEVEIDNAGAVDLDKNVKEYRSPRRAMLYSLAVPGWGQAYTKRTWKSVLFGALEVGFIVGAIKFKNDGEDKEKEAHSFADVNFSLELLQNQYNSLKNDFSDAHSELVPDTADVFLMKFITASTSNSISEFVANMEASSDAFYDRDHGVGSYGAILGWKDNIETEAVPFKVYAQTPFSQIDSVEVGGSAMQLQYNAMLGKADDYAGYKQAFIVGIFANHVASAIDAFITARRYNRRLLAMKNETAYRKRIIDNINIDNDLAFDARKGVVTKVGFKWSF